MELYLRAIEEGKISTRHLPPFDPLPAPRAPGGAEGPDAAGAQRPARGGG